MGLKAVIVDMDGTLGGYAPLLRSGLPMLRKEADGAAPHGQHL